MAVRIRLPVHIDYPRLTDRIDDLGVIAEVIVCKSFTSKFTADSTQRSLGQP